MIGSVGYTAGAFVAILQLGDGYPDPMRATATEAASVIGTGHHGRVCPSGPHTLCATAGSADAAAAGVAGDQQLGCQTVTVPLADDVGWLDPIRIAGGAIGTVSGWAQDPSDSAGHLQIQLYQNTAADTQLYPRPSLTWTGRTSPPMSRPIRPIMVTPQRFPWLRG